MKQTKKCTKMSVNKRKRLPTSKNFQLTPYVRAWNVSIFPIENECNLVIKILSAADKCLQFQYNYFSINLLSIPLLHTHTIKSRGKKREREREGAKQKEKHKNWHVIKWNIISMKNMK